MLPGMDGVSFDFARYIAYRKGQIAQRAQDGAAYSYAGERKVRRTLGSARPVAIAIEATTRLWRGSAKTELLATATRASGDRHPRVAESLRKAARALRLEPPQVYVTPPDSRITVHALGTNDEALVFINQSLAERLAPAELTAAIGHELGHVQNNQVLHATALYYLTHSAAMFVRWVVQPAIMTLQAWSRRAEITCDRAALLTTCDLDATLAAMVRLAVDPRGERGVDVAEHLAELPGSSGRVARYTELFRSHPLLPKRVQALRLFSESRFYRAFCGDENPQGLGNTELDDQVGKILSVF